MMLLSLRRARGDVGRVPLCVFEIEDENDEGRFAGTPGDGSALLGEISLASRCIPSGTAAEVDVHLRARHTGPRNPELLLAPKISKAKLTETLRHAGSFAKQAKIAAKAMRAVGKKRLKEAREVAECKARYVEYRNRQLAEVEAFRAKWKAQEERQSAQQAEYDRFINAGLTAAEADISALIAEIKRFGPGIPLHLVVEPALVSLAGGAKEGGMCFIGVTRPDDKRMMDALMTAIKAGAGREKVELALVPLE